MRFQDWDVLLFPLNSSIPIREFRTQCFAYQNGLTQTPLLTSFIPGLDHNAPFQVSVHAWNKPTAILGQQAGYAPGVEYVWRIKVIINGSTIVDEKLPEGATWPKQIDQATVGGSGEKLPFPKFHRSILSESYWNAAEEKGRIKIQLSAGYMIIKEELHEFVKLVDHFVFSFQPAPLDILERCGIAWPHPGMTVINNPTFRPKSRHVSIRELPLPLDDTSSRSTSAYSTYSPSAYGAMLPPPPPSMMSPVMNQASMSHHDAFRFRLPSDQVQQIIQAIKQPLPVASDAMPPPPLPQRLMPTPPMQPVADRTRGDSHYSDISMHAGCTSYPSCITEDGDGSILHNGHPTSVVKGRKEGSSSPTKRKSSHEEENANSWAMFWDTSLTAVRVARDFLSTVLDVPSPTVPPAPVIAPPPTPATMTVAPSMMTMSSPAGSGGSASAKKRTRSALRSLTLNEGTGSPEKKERPPRKASKGSGRGRSASRATEASDKENMMIE